MSDVDDLKARLLADRLASFHRLKGGYPVPLAGAAYWAVLAWVGYQWPPRTWLMLAMWGSGAIFPLALLLAKLLRNDFMRDRTATGDVLVPTFISMLLFWPMLAASLRVAPELAPLILAIGMSLHWPVIGWSYGKTALYTGHAVVRTVVALLIWTFLPEARFTLLPLSVCLVYLGTVAAILWEAAPVQPQIAERTTSRAFR
jgi:hypothetical protein